MFAARRAAANRLAALQLSNTALSQAIRNEHSATVAELVWLGAEINAEDNVRGPRRSRGGPILTAYAL